jgi:hypothetical protein
VYRGLRCERSGASEEWSLDHLGRLFPEKDWGSAVLADVSLLLTELG